MCVYIYESAQTVVHTHTHQTVENPEAVKRPMVLVCQWVYEGEERENEWEGE